MSDNTWTLWVCVCCLMTAANGECCDSDNHGGDGAVPLSQTEGRYVHPGIGWEDHDTSCLTHLINSCKSAHSELEWPDVPGDYECDCETNTYSTSQCDGCGSWLHGERHGMTMIEITTTSAPVESVPQPESTDGPSFDPRYDCQHCGLSGGH